MLLSLLLAQNPNVSVALRFWNESRRSSYSSNFFQMEIVCHPVFALAGKFETPIETLDTETYAYSTKFYSRFFPHAMLRSMFGSKGSWRKSFAVKPTASSTVSFCSLGFILTAQQTISYVQVVRHGNRWSYSGTWGDGGCVIASQHEHHWIYVGSCSYFCNFVNASSGTQIPPKGLSVLLRCQPLAVVVEVEGLSYLRAIFMQPQTSESSSLKSDTSPQHALEHISLHYFWTIRRNTLLCISAFPTLL